MANTAKKENRPYSVAHFVIELDGNKSTIGLIRSVDGGGVKSEIMTYQMGENQDLWRQIGKPKYEDLKLEFSMSFSDEFYNWIKSFFNGTVKRMNGAIVAADFQYQERARREFQNAIISEITFPKLDGSDKNPCYMSATIAPETLRFARPADSRVPTEIGKLRQKLWTASNFEFTIEGSLKDATRRCTKVDGFTIKQQVLEYHSGDKRDPVRIPGPLEFPNLTFYVPEADAQPFIDHYTKYGIGGQVQASPRLTGGIDMRDSTGEDLCTISIEGIDIASITIDKAESGGEKIREAKIEISVEKMDFKYVTPALD